MIVRIKRFHRVIKIVVIYKLRDSKVHASVHKHSRYPYPLLYMKT